MCLKHCWCRMEGGWEEKGVRLPAGGGRGAQKFGVSPAEGIQLFLETSGTYPECLPVRKLLTTHLPFWLTMFWIWISIHGYGQEPSSTLQSRWVARGHVRPSDPYLSCTETAASQALPLPPLVYQIHGFWCLPRARFLNTLGKDFVYFPKVWKQTLANTPKVRQANDSNI